MIHVLDWGIEDRDAVRLAVEKKCTEVQRPCGTLNFARLAAKRDTEHMERMDAVVEQGHKMSIDLLRFVVMHDGTVDTKKLVCAEGTTKVTIPHEDFALLHSVTSTAPFTCFVDGVALLQSSPTFYGSNKHRCDFTATCGPTGLATETAGADLAISVGGESPGQAFEVVGLNYTPEVRSEFRALLGKYRSELVCAKPAAAATAAATTVEVPVEYKSVNILDYGPDPWMAAARETFKGN